MTTHSPEGDRSVYSVLFESATVSREAQPSDPLLVNSSINDVTLLLPSWIVDQNANNTLMNTTGRGQATPQLPPVSQEVHLEFSEALHSMGRNETFLIDPEPLVKRYTTLSEDFEKRLRDLVANRPVGAGEIRELIEFFHNEKFTWKLVWAFLAAGQGNDSITNMEETAELRLPASDAEEIEELFDSSFDFRKIQTLVDWLEHRYAEEKCASKTASLHAYKDNGFMYECTRHAILKNQANCDIITELDPDAPIRQRRVLHEQDTEDEQRFFRCVFELVRAGKPTEAQKLAIDQGYFMLAAGMEGWKAFRGNIRDEEGNLLPDEGNPYRDVWKTVVWKKLADDRVNPAEKAIFAALSGCLEALLPLCTDWEDHLWAHLKVMVDVAIELHLRNSRGADIGRLPEEYPKENETIDHVLRTLENRPELNAGEFFRQLHKFLILQDAEGLLKMMFDSCTKLAEEDSRAGQKPAHQLRLMANLALFLRYHRQDSGGKTNVVNDPVNYIVAFYVDRLIFEAVYDVVPKYVLHLPGLLREQCYINLLRTLKNPADTQRRAIIEAAQREEIDIYDYLTKFVYEIIHQENQSATGNANEINDDDLQKMDALKWLFAQRGHSLLGLQYVNSALRSAVLARRLQVARKLIALVPTDGARELALFVVDRNQDRNRDARDASSVRRSRTRSSVSRGTMDSSEEMDDVDDVESTTSDQIDPIKCKNALKEYFCFQVYIEAHHSFTEWFEHFHRNRPQRADIAVGDTSDARRQLTAEFARKTLESKLESWQTVLNGLCERTSTHLYNILSYQDGGFLQDPCEEDVPDDSDQSVLNQETRRTEELRALRRLCLPEVVSLLHTVLHGTGRYAEAIDIANLVAGEALCLYKEFSKEDMAALLMKIQESSVELLKMLGKVDPYGLEDQ
ncbi:nuclear pore complex protein Nup107-like [Varroa destructor]|uniref:Nuclear pore complex protein n=1 Tax=Varroa destructor TaxID=109461 RepID=A0A7M7KAB3_VARDE|nr:nuclear pore complex protein Nup107-like [Varroa destructor]